MGGGPLFSNAKDQGPHSGGLPQAALDTAPKIEDAAAASAVKELLEHSGLGAEFCLGLKKQPGHHNSKGKAVWITRWVGWELPTSIRVLRYTVAGWVTGSVLTAPCCTTPRSHKKNMESWCIVRLRRKDYPRLAVQVTGLYLVPAGSRQAQCSVANNNPRTHPPPTQAIFADKAYVPKTVTFSHGADPNVPFKALGPEIPVSTAGSKHWFKLPTTCERFLRIAFHGHVLEEPCSGRPKRLTCPRCRTSCSYWCYACCIVPTAGMHSVERLVVYPASPTWDILVMDGKPLPLPTTARVAPPAPPPSSAAATPPAPAAPLDKLAAKISLHPGFNSPAVGGPGMMSRPRYEVANDTFSSSTVQAEDHDHGQVDRDEVMRGSTESSSASSDEAGMEASPSPAPPRPSIRTRRQQRWH